jgi:hypothetical protein
MRGDGLIAENLDGAGVADLGPAFLLDNHARRFAAGEHLRENLLGDGTADLFALSTKSIKSRIYSGLNFKSASVVRFCRQLGAQVVDDPIGRGLGIFACRRDFSK